MNFDDDGIKPTTRPVLTAALRALRDAREVASRIVGEALPGIYSYYRARSEWGVEVRWAEEPYPNDLAIRLIPPPDHFGGVTIEDLQNIKDALHADRVGVERDGVIWAHYDIDPREEETE